MDVEQKTLSAIYLDAVIQSFSTTACSNQKKESANEKFCSIPVAFFSCFHNAQSISGALVHVLRGIISVITAEYMMGSLRPC